MANFLDENGLSTLWERIKELIKKSKVQANWNQTDPTKDDYIQGKPSIFPPSAHTHTMSDISNFSVKSQFVVETYSEHSSKSVGTSGASATYNISKSGYYPLGIVGFFTSDANVLVRACYLNNVSNGSATINYYMRSISGTKTVTQTTRVLWVKI